MTWRPVDQTLTLVLAARFAERDYCTADRRVARMPAFLVDDHPG